MPRVPPRRLFAWILLSGMVAGAFDSAFPRMLDSSKRDEFRGVLEGITDEPGYLQFLREIEARTPAGSTIAILAPRRWGGGGYEYPYYRAVYLVDSRTIVPAIWTDNVPLRENLETADYLAAWQMNVDSPRHELVWRGAGGGLYKTGASN